MPDGAIVLPNIETAPKDYKLAGSQEIQLKTVRAVIDGSGAGSAFLPTLQLLDPNGNVMWEGATSTTVAAGGSADVSWFPGLGATGSSATTTTGATAYLWGVFGAQTIPTGTGSSGTVQFAHFQTNNTSVFGTATNAVSSPPYHNTTGDSYLYGLGLGSYVASGMAQLAAGVYAQNAIVDNPGSQWILDQDGSSRHPDDSEATNTDVFGAAGGQSPMSHRLFYVDGTTTPLVARLLVTQTSGAPQGLAHVSMGLIFGDGGTGTLTQIY